MIFIYYAYLHDVFLIADRFGLSLPQAHDLLKFYLKLIGQIS